MYLSVTVCVYMYGRKGWPAEAMTLPHPSAIAVIMASLNLDLNWPVRLDLEIPSSRSLMEIDLAYCMVMCSTSCNSSGAISPVCETIAATKVGSTCLDPALCCANAMSRSGL